MDLTHTPEVHKEMEHTRFTRWIDENAELFAFLRGGPLTESTAVLTPFDGDFDVDAQESGRDVHEHLEKLKELVGPLGEFELRLVWSTDNSVHVTVAGIDEELF